MPVRKFRSVEEMKAEANRVPNKLDSLKTFAYVQALAARLTPRCSPPSAYKHRSMEELNAQTEAWAADPATYVRSGALPSEREQAPSTQTPE